MALVLKDRVKETSTTAGTGTLTLAGAVTGFQSFAAVGNGNTTYYAIADSITGDWEVGIGTYTSSGTTLSRTTVLSSSNGGSLVNFAANPKDVFVTYPSEKSVYEDASNVVNATSFGAITATSAALTTGTVSTTPASNTDIANKQYVDGLVTQGISYHEPVYVESPNTTGNLNATYNNGASGVGATLTNAGTQVALTVDGILMTVGKRVLIYNQTNATQNGVYEVTTVGDGSTNWVLTRTADADTYGLRDPNALGYNDAFFVTNGNTGAGETYVCTTTGTITFGTTNITFAQISSAQVYTAGTGLNLSPATTFNISNTGVSANTYGSASAVPVFAVNAQGQITGVTNTNIAISGSAVSGNISGSAGSVANALTLGTYLTGTSFNGSAAVTATVDATATNTASKVVARDSSGNFAAGTITAALSGNASTATAATNISGGAANQIPYNTALATTAFITAPTTAGTYLNWNGSAFAYSAISTPASVTFNNGGSGDASGTSFNGSTARTISYNTVGAPSTGGTGATGTWGISISGNAATATSATSATTATQVSNSLSAGTYLTGSAFNGSSAQTWTVDATSANTASKVVARDVSGNFSAGTITAALSGNATTATTATQVSNSLTLATSGTGLSGSATFNGSSAQTFTVTSNATNLNTGSAIVARDASGNFSAGTITATLSGNASTATSATTAGSITSQANSATITASSSNTANQIVLRDASGNFSAGTITASLNGNASTSSSTSGNAATATALSSGQSNWSGTGVLGNVVGMLAWKNYANGHVIFDASASTSPSGGAVNNTNASVAWSSTYPTLMGWNGSSTYGVRVDSARISDSTSGSAGSVDFANLTNKGSGTGTYTTSGDYRAPIFYDSNDTAFYTDPNSTSSQKTILIGYASGTVYDVASSGVLTFGSTSDTPNYSIRTELESYSGNYSKLRFKWYTGIQYYASQAYGGHRFYDIDGTQYFGIGVGGNWSYSIYSHRAPIFYDYDNTGYYVDPASTSNLNNVQIVTLGVGTGGSGTTGEIRATANVTAYYSSDIKFKTNVRDIPNALETVESIGGKLFDWTNEYIEEHGGEDGYFIQKEDFGVIAQDVLKVFPVAVRTRPDGSLAVDYEKLSALAFAAVASLSTRVKSLEARI